MKCTMFTERIRTHVSKSSTSSNAIFAWRHIFCRYFLWPGLTHYYMKQNQKHTHCIQNINYRRSIFFETLRWAWNICRRKQSLANFSILGSILRRWSCELGHTLHTNDIQFSFGTREFGIQGNRMEARIDTFLNIILIYICLLFSIQFTSFSFSHFPFHNIVVCNVYICIFYT